MADQLSIDRARTALLIMDYQNEILAMLPEGERSQLLRNAQKILGQVRGVGLPVVYVVVRFREELGPHMKVIGTGGLAELIAKETNVIQIIAPWLTLDGLRIVYELNR